MSFVNIMLTDAINCTGIMLKLVETFPFSFQNARIRPMCVTRSAAVGPPPDVTGNTWLISAATPAGDCETSLGQVSEQASYRSPGWGVTPGSHYQHLKCCQMYREILGHFGIWSADGCVKWMIIRDPLTKMWQLLWSELWLLTDLQRLGPGQLWGPHKYGTDTSRTRTSLKWWRSGIVVPVLVPNVMSHLYFSGQFPGLYTKTVIAMHAYFLPHMVLWHQPHAADT